MSLPLHQEATRPCGKAFQYVQERTSLSALEPCEAEKAKIHPGMLHLKNIDAQPCASAAPMHLRLADSSSICFGCLAATIHGKHTH